MMRQGRGRFVDGASEEQTYEGEWADDMMQGRGTFRYASGAKYEVASCLACCCTHERHTDRRSPPAAQGEFVANKYNGHGIFTFPDGSSYEGPFVDSQMHGMGKYVDAQGTVWTGKFYNGVGPGLGHGSVVAK